MPLYLRAPIPGKTKNYEIRGSHLGVRVEESAQTGDERLAKQLLRKKERDIERGAVADKKELTFDEATERYLAAGGDGTYLFDKDAPEGEKTKPLLRHFADVPCSQIRQGEIDEAAGKLYPNETGATKNRSVYTPVSAVLKRAGYDFKIKRPKGWRGQRRTMWLRPTQAEAVFKACLKIKAPENTRKEFRIFCIVLCYTGMRLSDALYGMRCANVDLEECTALLAKTKNDNPRTVHLPPRVVDELKQLPKPLEGRVGRVFRFHKSGVLRAKLIEALEIAGVVRSESVAFHLFCHTWATWMRKYAGLTRDDLVDTDRWSDPESVKVYDHLVVSDVAKKADLLPGAKKEAA